jgi:hypothetical protein
MNRAGQEHRERDLPAHVFYRLCPERRFDEFWINGQRWRVDNGPTVEERWEDNSQWKLHWCDETGWNREDAPAIIWSNGFAEWFQRGRHHRLDGPAIEQGAIQQWWVDGLFIRGSPFGSQ